MKLERKVALVTGGARGIGAACARRFALEGAKVAVTDLDFADAECGDVLEFSCNVTVREEVEALVRRTVEELGGLDILVTCAGVTRDNLVHKVLSGSPAVETQKNAESRPRYWSSGGFESR